MLSTIQSGFAGQLAERFVKISGLGIMNFFRRPLEKDCSVEGEEICSTHFETECWTRQVRQEIEDDVPSCQPVVEQV